MQNPAVISAALQQRTDSSYARKRGKQIQPLRGLRGVPARDVVEVLVESWRASPLDLPDEAGPAHMLFTTAYEDGIVAIGLAAAALPDVPYEVLDLADRWIEIVDDVETADALGWLLFGPALLASNEPFVPAVKELITHEHPMRRRVGILACFSLMPTPIEGAAAAALRERLDQRRLAFVEEVMDDPLAELLPLAIHDRVPMVRKCISRAFRTWGTFSPDRVEEVIAGARGGAPRYLRDEATKGIKKGRRSLKQSVSSEESAGTTGPFRGGEI